MDEIFHHPTLPFPIYGNLSPFEYQKRIHTTHSDIFTSFLISSSYNDAVAPTYMIILPKKLDIWTPHR